MQIKFEVRGIEKIQAFLKSVPRGTLRVALAAFSEYLIGNERRGLRHTPNRVSHGPNNPYKWQSAKQRGAYFATNGFGKGIPYRRTGKLSAGWYSESKHGGYQMSIKNREKYADYVVGFLQQRGHWADGWRKARDVIMSNLSGAARHARAAVGKWIRENGK